MAILPPVLASAHDIEHIATLVSPEAGVGSSGTLELPVIIRNDSSAAKVALTAEVPQAGP